MSRQSCAQKWQPCPFTVKSVIEAEYGKPVASIFAEIDPTPLGSASIAQVHAAVLKIPAASLSGPAPRYP
ncbi:MAG: AarF/UbiB family protein [Clostridia bacterium]